MRYAFFTIILILTLAGCQTGSQETRTSMGHIPEPKPGGVRCAYDHARNCTPQETKRAEERLRRWELRNRKNP